MSLNDGYIAELFESFQRDPTSVDESWRQLFRLAQQLAGAASGGAPRGDTDPALLRVAAGAASLVQAIRSFGHFAVPLDPLGTPPHGAQELAPEFHGVTAEVLTRIPASALGWEIDGSAAEVVAHLTERYSNTLGVEAEHLQADAERQWFRREIESGSYTRPLTADEKRRLLSRLTEVDGFERFLGRAFVGHKRFSVEGTDAIVPMLDTAIEAAGTASASHGGARTVYIGMAHRGRLNVLAHIMGKPYATIFTEFEGKHALFAAVDTSGDVKYHLGAQGTRTLADGREVRIGLVPNPSHLEFVDPVLEGVVRAEQRVPGSVPGARDESRVVPIVIHGDSAFPGEGVVAETINLSRLEAYRTGGTLHIIVNNQVGFTTDPNEARSSYYASDLAEGFDIPILHVNADRPDTCVAAVRLGMAYRERFAKDFIIDLVGYRRHGHNEGDEPTYTQPQLYARVKRHPTVRALWARLLEEEGTIAPGEAAELDARFNAVLEQALTAAQSEHADLAQDDQPGGDRASSAPIETRVSEEDLRALNDKLLSWPEGFHVHPRLAKQLERRRAQVNEPKGIDWGHAEALAFASLLSDGVSIRLSGQDAERGTFSHRHAVLHDTESGATHTPLQHITDGSRAARRGRSYPAAFEIHNSPLSETAVMAFEYGYSAAAEDALVLWEAQFGDFANVAQPIIDQFIASDRTKWGQDSGLVLLLPHGHEGQGPEHSSARLERFLQLCAQGNMRVAYPSTAGQYFHILRRQAKSGNRRPLILMTPKSLLRDPQAAVGLAVLANSGFEPVIDDPAAASQSASVRRLIFCTGKIYYELTARLRQERGATRSDEPSEASGSPIAIVRVEELYPWPHDAVGRVVDQYPTVEEVMWVQEEPRNMGAWSYVAPLLRALTGNLLPLRYVGRAERASPAEGYKAAHDVEQQRIVDAAVELQAAGAKRRSAAARS